MSIAGGIVLNLVSLIAGLIGLWPVRRRLGAWGYSLAAYPVGLVLWPVTSAVLSALRVGYHPMPVYVAAVVFLFGVCALIERRSADSGSSPVPAWSLAVWIAVVGGVSALVALTGITSAAYDSIFHYEAWGVWLFDTGAFSKEIMGAYGAFMPSIHAASRFFGSDWTATPYPVLSLHAALVVFIAIRQWGAHRIGAVRSVLVAAVATGLMISTVPYRHNTLYVHSQMITATYLVLSLWAIQRAYLGADGEASRSTDASRAAWLLVAGIATAGLALTRTDGIAYLIVPLVVATFARLESGAPARSHLLYLTSLALPIAAVYASAFYTLRGWQSDKLTGRAAAMILVAVGLLGVLTLVIDRVPALGPWLQKRHRAIALVAVVEVVGIAGIVMLRPTGFAEAGHNMVVNLFQAGGYGFLWYFAVGVLILGIVWRALWRSGRWPAYLACGIAQFFAIAVLVHGLSHSGRLGPADSFSRLAFHAVPLVFWFAGLLLVSIVKAYPDKRSCEVA